MAGERHLVLELVAQGRITPREAERWLAAWQSERVTQGILIACFVLAALGELHGHQGLRALGGMVEAAIRNAAMAIHQVLGGMQ
jgi:hypothetical protein